MPSKVTTAKKAGRRSRLALTCSTARLDRCQVSDHANCLAPRQSLPGRASRDSCSPDQKGLRHSISWDGRTHLVIASCTSAAPRESRYAAIAARFVVVKAEGV